MDARKPQLLQGQWCDRGTASHLCSWVCLLGLDYREQHRKTTCSSVTSPKCHLEGLEDPSSPFLSTAHAAGSPLPLFCPEIITSLPLENNTSILVIEGWCPGGRNMLVGKPFSLSNWALLFGNSLFHVPLPSQFTFLLQSLQPRPGAAMRACCWCVMESNTYLREGVNACWRRAWPSSLSPLPAPNVPQLWKSLPPTLNSLGPTAINRWNKTSRAKCPECLESFDPALLLSA